MTKQKTCNGAAKAAPLQNTPQSTFSAACEAGTQQTFFNARLKACSTRLAKH
jgi:hypothetical protein